MIEQKVKVTTNIEAKSAALFVQTANKFTSNIKVKIDNRIVNAKSIMGMIFIFPMYAIPRGWGSADMRAAGFTRTSLCLM